MQAIYDEIAKEIKAGKIAPGLWVRVLAESNGDRERAQGLYIQRRYQQLKKQKVVRETQKRLLESGEGISEHNSYMPKKDKSGARVCEVV